MTLRRTSTRRRKNDNVGFSTLPEQVHRKTIKKGFEFTLLVLGDSGLGKSTLVNSLFMTNLYEGKSLENVNERINKTISITTRTAELEEKGVRLKLTAVDTPGFGDTLDGKDNWKSIQEYIDQQFYSYYIQENGFGEQRLKLVDTRVHCCLYFMPPYVRGLRPIDIQTMLALQKRVNIVPIIAKSDSLTKKELENLKKNIMNDIEKYAIELYKFPECESDDDEDFKKAEEEIKSCMPFAVIGSNTIIESGGKKVRGRIYPWGIIDIESNSCDFSKLRTFLCSHMSDLKDLTHDVHYENYRTELMKSPTFNANMMQALQKPGADNLRASRRMPVEEANRLLQQKDAEIKKMQDLLNKMKTNMINASNNQQNIESRNSNQHSRLQGNDQALNVNRRQVPKNVKEKNDLLILPSNPRKNPLANEFLASFKINSTPI